MHERDCGEIYSIGVDWITCVGKEENSVRSMLSLGSELVTWRMRTGFVRKGWGMSGFSGFSSEGVQYGIRNKESIVRLSGTLAHSHWRKLYEMADSVSRCDFECTTATGRRPDERISRAFAAARRNTRGKKKSPAVTHIRNHGGGSTLYLGKRQSMMYGRIYNKEVESSDPNFRNCVRHEIELKGRLCSLTVARLARSSTPQDDIRGYLSQFFERRGVAPEFSRNKLNFIKVPHTVDDHRRSLRWLRTQCGPTVQRLVAAGMGRQILDVLQLDQLVQEEIQRRQRPLEN